MSPKRANENDGLKAPVPLGAPESHGASGMGRPGGPQVAMEFGDRALTLISACATIGSLYFVGICIGYLLFAGVLPEFRLRYLIAALFGVVALLRIYMLLALKVFPTLQSRAMYGLYAMALVMQAFWFLPIRNGGGMEQYLTTIGDSIVASGILAITGECYGLLWSSRRADKLLWRPALAFAGCVGVIALGVSKGWDATAEMRLLFQSQNVEGAYNYNYLALGDSIALLGLIVLGLSRTMPVRLGVIITSAVALFFAYSRTSFFLFLLCSTLVFLIGGKNSQRIGLAAAMAVVLLIGLAAASESDVMRPAIERMTVLLTDRAADESYVARQAIMSENIGFLAENWLVGRFMDEWFRTGQVGGYIHNWLSFWQSYGLIPFLTSITLFAAISFRDWNELRRPTESSGAAMALFMYALIAIITSRAYAWPYIWLVLGIVTSLARPRASTASLAR